MRARHSRFWMSSIQRKCTKLSLWRTSLWCLTRYSWCCVLNKHRTKSMPNWGLSSNLFIHFSRTSTKWASSTQRKISPSESCTTSPKISSDTKTQVPYCTISHPPTSTFTLRGCLGGLLSSTLAAKISLKISFSRTWSVSTGWVSNFWSCWR